MLHRLRPLLFTLLALGLLLRGLLAQAMPCGMPEMQAVPAAMQSAALQDDPALPAATAETEMPEHDHCEEPASTGADDPPHGCTACGDACNGSPVASAPPALALPVAWRITGPVRLRAPAAQFVADAPERPPRPA